MELRSEAPEELAVRHPPLVGVVGSWVGWVKEMLRKADVALGQ